MRVGNVHINYPAWNPAAPFGGYKRSGNGREYAEFGLVEYLDERAQPHTPPQEAPDAGADRWMVLERLAGHMAALKPDWRVPLVLSVVHGYSIPEIAAMLDLNYEAAKKRLYRGRDEFHRRLRRDPRCSEFFGEEPR